jgi:hypothetical protein
MTFWIDPAAVDREWLPFVGSVRPGARLASWAALWLSGLLVCGLGTVIMILALTSALAARRFRVHLTLDSHFPPAG